MIEFCYISFMLMYLNILVDLFKHVLQKKLWTIAHDSSFNPWENITVERRYQKMEEMHQELVNQKQQILLNENIHGATRQKLN